MSKTELGVIGLVLLFLVVIITVCIVSDNQTMHKGYAAWVKQTGNTNNLSYDEWHDLVESTKASRTPIFIYTH